MQEMTFAQAVARLKELVDQESSTAWEMGDIALRMVPMGADHTNNGADEKVRALAESSGIDPEVLKRRRIVSSQFPEVTRVTSVSWSVYREIGNVSDLGERARLLKMILTEEPRDKEGRKPPSGRWTVSTVRQQMGLSAILHVSEPVAEHVERATTEEQAAIYSSLRRNPEVVKVARQQEEGILQDMDERHERLVQESPISRGLDAAKAVLELERAMVVFVRAVADIFPRIKGLPNPATDPLHRVVSMRQVLASTYGAADQIKALLDTGRPGGDIDNFLRKVLSETKEEGK